MITFNNVLNSSNISHNYVTKCLNMDCEVYSGNVECIAVFYDGGREWIEVRHTCDNDVTGTFIFPAPWDQKNLDEWIIIG